MNKETVYIVHSTNGDGLSCVLGVYNDEWLADGFATALVNADFPAQVFITRSAVLG